MISIPFIYFLILSLLHYRKTKTLDIGFFLLALYTFSSFMSIVLYKSSYLNYYNSQIKLTSCIYYCGILSLFIMPFLSNRQGNIERIIRPNLALFKLISYFFIIINLIAIIFILDYTVFVLTHNPGAFKIGASLILKKLGYSIGPFESIANYIFGHFSDFYILILIFYFYSITYLTNKQSFNVLLLISSMSTIINGLNTGGRTQMIYWILVFISCYLYFKDQMSKQIKKYIIKVFIIIISIFSFYFIGVTIYRFSHNYSSSSSPELLSLVDYAGQSFINFNEFFTKFHHSQYTIARIFPILHDLFSSSKFDLNLYRGSLPMNIGVFLTFIGDLFIDVGIGGTIIYLLIFLFVFYLTQANNKNKSKQFYQVLLFFMLLQIPLNGLFFYSLWNKVATISIIGTIVLSLLFMALKKETNE
jgi:oligosaccharide repeat unit polymerase